MTPNKEGRNFKLRNRNKHIATRGIALVQLLIWTAGVIIYLRSLIDTDFTNFGILGIIFQVCFFLYFIYFIYSQFCLAFNKNTERMNWYIGVAFWTNVFQIPQLILWGYTYYFNVGFKLLIFYAYQTHSHADIAWYNFGVWLGLNYQPAEFALIGVNLSPLIFAIFIEYVKPAKASISKVESDLIEADQWIY